MITISIREQSIIARIAAMVLKAERVAIVLGKTIYLWNTSKDEFLENKRWLRHELVHIAQYQHHGFLNFLFLYISEWLQHGYYHNKFEVEARAKETMPVDFDYKVLE